MPAASPAAATASDDGAPTLAAASLGGQRGERPLFRAVELTLRPGQVVWLRGRNGRGKTSLLRLLAGLSTPAQGQVLCDGQPLPKLAPQWRRRLLYIAHANALKDDLTVAESLRFLGALHGRAPSAGEIAAALARLALPQPPSVWLLDEPFDALDDEGVQALQALLSGQARRGGSVLFTSHQAVDLQNPEPQRLDLDDFAIAA